MLGNNGSVFYLLSTCGTKSALALLPSRKMEIWSAFEPLVRSNKTGDGKRKFWLGSMTDEEESARKTM